jgi:hypothetical protein
MPGALAVTLVVSHLHDACVQCGGRAGPGGFLVQTVVQLFFCNIYMFLQCRELLHFGYLTGLFLCRSDGPLVHVNGLRLGL